MDQSLLENFNNIRQLTLEHCKPLQKEDFIPQVKVFASPPLWHLAHTTWFFEEMILKSHLENYKCFHEDFSFLFNSYYDSIGERIERTHRGAITRPGVDMVYKYRKYVDEHIAKLFDSNNLSQEIIDLLTLGLNHEQQHQELLLTDLKLALSYNPLNPVYSKEFTLEVEQDKIKGWVNIEEGVYQIGHNDSSFSFDNELGTHQVYINPFSISKSLVTNGEYLDFINDGGYSSFNHWLNEGWNWVKENNASAPLYWKKNKGKWYQFTLSGLIELDLNAPLSHINFFEANAFAAWKGMRLPTEFEWEISSKQFDWGKRWEWTGSAYLPYPNFKIEPGAIGEYNGKFMVNQMVLRGGSIATSANHSRATYRNFFHPQMQWQFSGIRLVK